MRYSRAPDVSAERIGNEALGSQVRAAEIAAGEAGAADPELPGNAQRGESAGGHDDVDADVRQRPADARRGRAGREGSDRGVHRALGRAIDVPEAGAASPASREGRVAEVGVDGFASHQDERGRGVSLLPSPAARSGRSCDGVQSSTSIRCRRTASTSAAGSKRTSCGRMWREWPQASWTSCLIEPSKENEALTPTRSAPASSRASSQ